jgi:hypothetical protein
MPADDYNPEPPLKPIGKDKLFMAVLLILAAMAFYYWLVDPSHQRDGKSRVDWPPAKAKP